MQKGEFILAILDIVENLACGTAELIDTMTSGRSESYAKLRGWKQAAPNAKRAIRSFINDIKIGTINKQRIYERLSQLKKDGLIFEEDPKNRKALHLTSKGVKKLSFLKTRFPWTSSYKCQKSDQLIIVAFDVPEKERWKRKWLRSALKNMELRFLQQSLWIGKVKLPKDFLDDLDKLRMSGYVEIFAVAKTGTIRQLA